MPVTAVMACRRLVPSPCVTCPDMHLRCVNCQHVVSVPDGFGRYFDMPVRCHACRRVFTVPPRHLIGGATPRARQGGGLTGPCQREGTIISSAVRPARRRSVLQDSRFLLCRSGLCARTAVPAFDTGRIGMPTGLIW